MRRWVRLWEGEGRKGEEELGEGNPSGHFLTRKCKLKREAGGGVQTPRGFLLFLDQQLRLKGGKLYQELLI